MKQPNPRLLLPVIVAGLLFLAAAIAVPRLGGLASNEPGTAQGIAALDALDYHAARTIFTQLAEKGDPAAETWLGHMAEEGLGQAPDGAQAAQWYRKAADAHAPDAARHLGELYLHGLVVPQDGAAARHWLALAAAGKDEKAERELGELYAQGIGGPRDNGQAYGWLALAASDGDLQAARERDYAAATLSPDAARAALTHVQASMQKGAAPSAPAPKIAQDGQPRPRAAATRAAG